MSRCDAVHVLPGRAAFVVCQCAGSVIAGKERSKTAHSAAPAHTESAAAVCASCLQVPPHV